MVGRIIAATKATSEIRDPVLLISWFSGAINSIGAMFAWGELNARGRLQARYKDMHITYEPLDAWSCIVDPNAFARRIRFKTRPRTLHSSISNNIWTTIMANSAEARVETGGKTYEVADFLSVAPDKDYVLVSHYRTVQGDGGHIVNEPVVTTEELIAKMIRAFDGLSSSVPQGLHGVFQRTGDARECAAAIVTHHGKRTEVVGSELLVFL